MHHTCPDTDLNPPETAASPPVPTDSLPGSRLRLYGRRAECRALTQLLADVRTGQNRVLVVRGETGAGKTTLLAYLAEQASSSACRVARMAGTPSESELAFAGLHQLCAPLLSRVERLPLPQRDALRYASGLAAGPSPDGFVAGLAMLNLLAGVAAERPLICLIDGEQWLDRASVQALGFAARRLTAEPIGLVFATREPGAELAGLPELHVGGLREDDARTLLAATLAGPLDARVRDIIVAETRGNPLALLEVPRRLSPAELAGGFGLPGAAPLADRIQDGFTRQLNVLPEGARRLVQLAAADPTGDRQLLWRAADQLGIPVRAAAPAVEARLVEFGTRVRFCHPLARSAAYWSASVSDRQQMHAALAAVIDMVSDPDRSAWHRAQAVSGPNEKVAAELERWAGRAQARGGLAAAAAFLERSVLLTADPERHAERALTAAHANMRAGAFGNALDLLAEAEAQGSRPLDELASARVELLRGQIMFASGSAGAAPAVLFKAAKRLEPLDAGLARQAYLSAWMAALFAGRLAGGDLFEICHAVRALTPRSEPPPADLVLDGLAMIVTDGPAAAAPTLRRAVSAVVNADIAADEPSCWGWQAQAAASALWDNDARCALLVRQVRLAREAGVLDQLPVLLEALGTAVAASGDIAAASVLVAEAEHGLRRDRGASRPADRDAARGAAGASRRSRAAHRGRHRRCPGRRTGNRGGLRALGDCRPAQRPRLLRGGAGGRQAGLREHHGAACLDVGAARAGRGGRARRAGRAGPRCPQAAGGDDAAMRPRFRARNPGALPGAAQR